MTAVAPPPILVDEIVPRPQLTGTEPCLTGEEAFTHPRYTPDQPGVRAAQRACRHCPLTTECLIWAISNPTLTPDGIYGASTPRQRNAHRKQLADRLGTGAAYERVLRRAYEAAVTQRTTEAIR